MANVGNTWTVVRTKDISGGFLPDPNWEATQDILGWEATKPLWHDPNYARDGAGKLELLVIWHAWGHPALPARFPSRRL